MTTIKIISASAGSGKTTRLARLLEESVTSGQARPDAIVATTFTTKNWLDDAIATQVIKRIHRLAARLHDDGFRDRVSERADMGDRRELVDRDF